MSFYFLLWEVTIKPPFLFFFGPPKKQIQEIVCFLFWPKRLFLLYIDGVSFVEEVGGPAAKNKCREDWNKDMATSFKWAALKIHVQSDELLKSLLYSWFFSHEWNDGEHLSKPKWKLRFMGYKVGPEHLSNGGIAPITRWNNPSYGHL